MGAVDDFLRRAKGAGLLSADDIAACQAAVPHAAQSDDVKKLAAEFVRRGLMTKYQANAVWQGKHDSLLLGDYLLQEVIGQGGMGTVFKAVHRPKNRVVAVKTLNPAAMKASDAVDRFRREADLVGKLNHRNIVAAFDAGEIRGQHYLAMEYVPGIDLERRVHQQGPIAPEAAAACILQAARGLEYAHTRGVLHRDVKPANLLLAAADPPVVKLLDLGLAWIRDNSAKTESGDPAGRLTQNDRIMGTVAYMAPEQALEIHTADQRADIYSLGCTFYFLVAGKVMYGAESVLKQLVAHREAPIPALPRAKPALSAVLARMVAKQPEQRYQSMTEVIAALEKSGITDAHLRTIDDAPKTAVQVADDTEVDFDSYTSTSLSKSGTVGSSRKSNKKKTQAKQKAAAQRKWLAIGSAATAVVVLLGILIAVFSGGHRGTNVEPVLAQTPSPTPPRVVEAPPARAETPPPMAVADFDPTGEYIGTLAGEPWGFQVRRQAGDTFAVRLLEGGLPGEGWDQKTAYDLTASKTDGRIALDKNARLVATFEPDVITGTNAVGEAFKANRVTRKSVMRDKPPPLGAAVLFVGQSAEAWSNAVVTAEGTLAAGTSTTAAYRDFTLHLEYLLPVDVTDTTPCRVRLQNRYDILIDNSFGQAASPNSAAAIAGQTAPLLNMSLPHGTWQTLDIAFVAARFDDSGVKTTNARCTVRHNGVIVHDNVELRGATDGVERPEPGPITLSPTAASGVVFRNLWISESRPAGLLAGQPTSWPEPNAAVAKRFTALQGLLQPEFAFVQTLQLDEFAKFAESLQEAGYRPVRLRPYATNKNVQTAALWQRDGHEWQLVTGTAAELQQQAKQLQAEGLWPVDVAGYAAKSGDLYVSLWARLPEKPAEEARIYPGVRHLSLASTFGDFPNQGFAERIDQAFVIGRSQIMHSTLWWKSPTKTEGWFGDLAYFESHRKGVLLDLCIGRGPLTGAPVYSWCSLVDDPPGVESLAVYGLAPDAHLKRSAELVEQGYKPVVIGAAQVTAPIALQTCSVWHRRKPASPADR